MERRIIDKRKKEKFMVDDEYLNGQAKLCGVSASMVYMVLCRHASQGQECFPSNKLIAEKLGISVRTVITATQTLEDRHIISVEKTRKKDGQWLNNKYILLDKIEWLYDQVQPLHVDEPSAKNDVSQVQKTTHTQVQPLHTKETHNTKETNKEGNTSSERGSQGINGLIKLFEPVNPSYEKFYPNKTQRAALERLVKKYNEKNVAGLIKYLAIMNEDRYAKGKSITPLEMENNLAHIHNHYKQKVKEKNNFSVDVIS